MDKICYILRAISGAGKSTLAEYLVSGSKSSVICSADDFLTDENGNYNWDQDTVGIAHVWCKNLFKENLEDNTEIIVISNTNVTNKDVNYYRKRAIEYGYLVFVLVVENRHDGNNIHNVPDATKIIMKQKLMKSIKL